MRRVEPLLDNGSLAGVIDVNKPSLPVAMLLGLLGYSHIVLLVIFTHIVLVTTLTGIVVSKFKKT